MPCLDAIRAEQCMTLLAFWSFLFKIVTADEQKKTNQRRLSLLFSCPPTTQRKEKEKEPKSQNGGKNVEKLTVERGR